MTKKIFFYPLALVFIFSSCSKDEKSVLISAFDEMYGHVLNLDFDQMNNSLNQQSKEFYNEITLDENLNIDSMIVLGQKYRIPYILVNYLALYGDKIKKGAPKTDFYRYLGIEKVSFFSFEDAYYTDKSKTKIGAEPYVAIVRDDLTQSRLSWARFTKDEANNYKYDLLYTLQTKETADKKRNYQLRQMHNGKSTKEEYLRFLYWQNSGEDTEKFKANQTKMEASMLEERAEMIDILKQRANK